MPSACSREINKVLGATWANYSKLDKKKFTREAKDYKLAIALNLKTVEDRIGLKLKKPVCSYSLFVKDCRSKSSVSHPNLTHIEIMQYLSQKWKSLTASKR